MAIDVGRVCIKTAGREAGRACVVIDTIDETYVMITGPKNLTKVRRRKCNIAHLEPLEFQLKVSKNAADTEVAKLLQAEKILEGMPAGRPARPRKEEKPERPEAPEKEKMGLRERLLGRTKGEEKPKEKSKAEKKEEKPKPEKPKEKIKPKEKKPEKPKGKPKPRKEKTKPKPEKAANKKPAKKAKPAKKKK